MNSGKIEDILQISSKFERLQTDDFLPKSEFT